jgi:hypothetical protein
MSDIAILGRRHVRVIKAMIVVGRSMARDIQAQRLPNLNRFQQHLILARFNSSTKLAHLSRSV